MSNSIAVAWSCHVETPLAVLAASCPIHVETGDWTGPTPLEVLAASCPVVEPALPPISGGAPVVEPEAGTTRRGRKVESGSGRRQQGWSVTRIYNEIRDAEQAVARRRAYREYMAVREAEAAWQSQWN